MIWKYFVYLTPQFIVDYKIFPTHLNLTSKCIKTSKYILFFVFQIKMSVVERFANPEGRSTIRYYEDGAKIVTGGPDGGM